MKTEPMMLDPHHECWWTTNRRTELHWQAARFGAAGVSLRVLLAAWQDANVVWFSRIYGDYDDNLAVIAIDRAVAATLPQLPYAEAGPIAHALPEQDLAEYQLTPELLSALGCWPNKPNETAEERLARACTALFDHQDSRLRLNIALHDDCFFGMSPVPATELLQLITAVLAMHSFYQQRAINWGQTADHIADRLHRYGELRITSVRSPAQLVLSWPNRAGFFARLLQSRIEESIVIEDNVALPP
jgi:hypothetical protein